MAGTTTHPQAVRQALADLIGDSLDSGFLKFHITGSTADAPSTVVATLTLAAAAFGPANSSGVATAGAIGSDTNATGGTIAFATLQTSGSVVKAHCTVGTGGDAINVTSGGLAVTAGDTVSCSALTYQSAP
jgi:hypothetical protein